MTLLIGRRFFVSALAFTSLLACSPRAFAETGGIQWYTDIPNGATHAAVDGIVADNPAGATMSTPGVNLIYADLPAGFTSSAACTLYNANHSSTDSRGLNNVGSAWISGSKLYYLPPDEYNEIQQPRSVSEVTGPSTRTVTLHLSDSSGPSADIPIIIARPPVVLVHGINSYPGAWKNFVGRITKPPSGDSEPANNSLNIDIKFTAVNHRDPATYTNPTNTTAFFNLSDPGSDTPPHDPNGWGLFHGNGPIEVGAYLLEQRIEETLYQIRTAGAYSTSPGNFEDKNQNNPEDNAPLGGDTAFGAQVYTNPSNPAIHVALSAHRADVVGWSYGGMMARWYINSDGSGVSASWYQHMPALDGYPDLFNVLPATNYSTHNDIRKLITIASMWRGVPLTNFANETRIGGTLATNAVLPAPSDSIFAGVLNVGGLANVVDTQFIPLDVPSIEVMAVNSPWLRKLVYGNPAPYSAQSSKLPITAFRDDVAYGSVAGTNSRYLTRFHGIPIPVNPYDAFDLMQQVGGPHFPYLGLEHKSPLLAFDFTGTANDWTDGVVPVWSTLIPGTYPRTSTAVDATHTSIIDADSTDTVSYVVRWLNNSALPQGRTLAPLWNQAIPAPDGSRSWTFLRGQLAPSDRDAVYQQVLGLGRLNLSSVLELSPDLTSDGSRGLKVHWKTTIPTYGNVVHVYPLGNFLIDMPVSDPLIGTDHTVWITEGVSTGAIIQVESQVPNTGDVDLDLLSQLIPIL